MRYPANLTNQLPDKHTRAEISFHVPAGTVGPFEIFRLPAAAMVDPGGTVLFKQGGEIKSATDAADRVGGMGWFHARNTGSTWILLGGFGFPAQNIAVTTATVILVPTVDGSGDMAWQLDGHNGVEMLGTFFLTADKLITTHEGIPALPEP